MTHARTRGGKPDRCCCARKKFNFDFRYVSHAQHPIAIEIRIFRLPFDQATGRPVLVNLHAAAGVGMAMGLRVAIGDC
jgi:hypothetical protein